MEVTSASRQGAKVVVKSGLMKQSSKKWRPRKPPKLNRAKSAPDSDGYSSASSQGKAKGDASSIARQRALERSLKRKISLEEAKLRKENLIDHDREKRRLSDRIEQLEVLLAGSIEGKRHMEQEYLELMGKRAELKDEESMNSEVLEGPLGHESDQVAAITSQGGGAFATSDSEKEGDTLVSMKIRKVSSKKKRQKSRLGRKESRKTSVSVSANSPPHCTSSTSSCTRWCCEYHERKW